MIALRSIATVTALASVALGMSKVDLSSEVGLGDGSINITVSTYLLLTDTSSPSFCRCPTRGSKKQKPLLKSIQAGVTSSVTHHRHSQKHQYELVC